MKLNQPIRQISLAFLAGIFVFLCAFSVSAANKKPANSFSEPDFAYPETVAKNALEVLKNTKSPEDKFKAALQTVISGNIVSADSIVPAALLLDSLANISAVPYRQFYLLTEAKLYSDYFHRNSWKFNSRNLPSDALEDSNPAEWSAAMFSERVMGLLHMALSPEDELQSLPLKDYESLLADNFEDFCYFPTVYDFIAVNSIQLLSPFRSGRSVIPFYTNGSSASGVTGVSEFTDRIISSERKRFECKNSAAWSYWTIQGAPAGGSERNNYLLNEYVHKADTPFAGNLLECLNIYSMDTEEKSRVYDILQTALKNFPEAPWVDAVKQRLEFMSFPSVSISVKGQYLAKEEITGEAVISNLPAAWLLLLKVPDSVTDKMLRPSSDRDRAALMQLMNRFYVIDSKLLRSSSEIPFSDTIPFSLKGRSFGRYLLVASSSPGVEGIQPSAAHTADFTPLIISDLRILESEEPERKDSRKLWVVSGRNQKPIEGAKVDVYKWDNKRTKRVLDKTLTSDSKGLIPLDINDALLDVSIGGDRLSYTTDVYYFSHDKPDAPVATLLTDLSIYHPGDSVRMAVILFDPVSHKICPDRDLEIVLSGMGKECGSITLRTDADGRASGVLLLPDDGVLGYYGLSCSVDGNSVGYSSITVADYKAPGFYVELQKESDISPENETVLIRGVAKTYSGMPVIGSQVDFSVNATSGWWWQRSDYVDGFYGGRTETDGNGEFLISLPVSNLKDTPYSRALFSVSAKVTSPSGETIISPDLRFTLCSAYRISADLPEKILLSDKHNGYGVNVYDALSSPVAKEVNYTISRSDVDSIPLLTGKFISPAFSPDFSSLSSGRYKISFRLEENPEISAESNVVIYRLSDEQPPVSTPLWIPKSQYIYPDKSRSVEVTVGSSLDDGWILCQLAGEKGVNEWNWIQITKENKRINIPVSGKACRLFLAGTSDLSTVTSIVDLIPESAKEEMQTEVITFRDKISSGSDETWEFKYLFGAKIAEKIPVMAVMTDHALDALAPFNWNFSPENYFSQPYYTNINFSRLSSIKSVYGWRKMKTYTHKQLFASPELNLFGYSSLFPGYGFSRSIKVRGRGVETDEVMMESAVYMSAAPAMNSAMMKKEAQTEITALTEDEASDDSGDITVVSGSQEEKATALRTGECPLAFFLPSLSTDSKGNLSLKFHVPDYNTTWKLQMLGYDRDLHSSVITKLAQASKPVMVSPNLPRFVRTGDRVRFGVTAYNNSGDTQSITCRIEFFNPATDEIISTYSQTKEVVAPGDSFTVYPEFTAPMNENLIGVRSYASASSFTDGEQTLISVLPSSSPVLSSVTFYSGLNDNEICLTLPEYGENATVSLQYCDNPVWSCVEALPGILNGGSQDILSVTDAYFANRTGAGLCRRFPALTDGLGKWTTNPPVTPLSDNSSLKTFALENTIWVRDAESQQMKLDNLHLLLDKRKLEETEAKLIARIKALHRRNGGWSWCPGMQSSYFITSRVLNELGMLRKNGFLDTDSEISSMINDAIAYCDSEMLESYKKYKQLPGGLTEWLYIRSFFDKPYSPEFARLRSKGLKAVQDDWRKAGISEAAECAVLLWREGSESTARQILASLAEKSIRTPLKGMYYDNLSSVYGRFAPQMAVAKVLEAFAEIEPDSKYIDMLRQWLLIQKQTLNWGEGRFAVEAVYAMLSSGTDWTQAISPALIKLNGKDIEIPFRDNLSGEFTINLDSHTASGAVLSIERNAPSPAWGGVIAQSLQDVAAVRAEASGGISIDKEVLVVETSGKGTELVRKVPSVGDRVRVMLTITADNDLDYLAIRDERAACLEPAEQLATYRAEDGVWYYYEPENTVTDLFISSLPKGVFKLWYDCYVTQSGSYALGIVTAQSQYAPVIVAHSGGSLLIVEN